MVGLQNGMAEQQLNKVSEGWDASLAIVSGELADGCKQAGKVGQAAA
jgi:hypothetical protein